MDELKAVKGSSNIFADLGFDAEEAQNLLLRSQTMIVISKWFDNSGLTQAAAAKTLGLTQPRSSSRARPAPCWRATPMPPGRCGPRRIYSWGGRCSRPSSSLRRLKTSTLLA